jgi:hypothetical protein
VMRTLRAWKKEEKGGGGEREDGDRRKEKVAYIRSATVVRRAVERKDQLVSVRRHKSLKVV